MSVKVKQIILISAITVTVIMVTLLESNIIASPLALAKAMLYVRAIGTDESLKNLDPHYVNSLTNNAINVDNTTLASVPVLNDAVNKALQMYVPPNTVYSLPDPGPYSVEISQNDATSIMDIAKNANKAFNDLPYNTTDYGTGKGVVVDKSGMTLKYNGYYYDVFITQISQ